MDDDELDLTTNRVSGALTGISAGIGIDKQYYESTAAAFFIIKDPKGGIKIGDSFNVGVDIGGGSIDLFSFQSIIGGKKIPIPACIDSVKNAAGRKILSETFVKAAKHYYAKKTDPNPNSNPFFTCFMAESAPPSSLNSASDNAAICITETFIPDAKFDDHALGNAKRILNTFRKNVLFKTIAVLNYAAAFVKASWKEDEKGNETDFSDAEVNIILCGNGSSVFSEEWSGIGKTEKARITEFLKRRIGCKSLTIQPSGLPKKETVTGMKYIAESEKAKVAKKDEDLDYDSFVQVSIPASLNGRSENVAKNYVDTLLNEIISSKLLIVKGDVDTLNGFHALLKREIDLSAVRAALDYVLDFDEITNKGDEMFLADVFLRIALDLPFIDPYN